MFTLSHPLRVGTDCSGIEAPIVALRKLRVPFVHEFSSEIDHHCIATIKANFSPRVMFGDMTRRSLGEIPDIDLYVCGFPCQPFSTAGKRLGERDPRGTIFWECLRVIRCKKPMVFILENVKGIVSIDGGKTFETIIESLKRLKMYQIEWKILNTADYGIPQSRKRVYIVGMKKGKMQKPFQWPDPVPCKPLKDFVDWGDKTMDKLTERYEKQLEQIRPDAYFIDLGFTFHRYPNADRICPTLTAHNTLFNRRLHRFMNTKEYLKLQGFPTTFRIPITKNQIQKRIGNAMSVNVLHHLLQTMFQP